MARPTHEHWQELSPYLDQALTLSEGERAHWLEGLRQQDAALAARLEKLLEEQHAMRREGFLENRPAAFPGADASAEQTVGAYRLISPLGRGGMSTVWLAERSDGRFEGRVAVKFLNIALIGNIGQERFKREGSILGRLTHSHIAHLMDAGVSASGQPYLVLEHVEGEHIDQYCDQRGLNVEARLRLFLDVLSAVAHAHANLIVHRDIKPSNVLVTKDGQVKLLDFGIAKLLEEQEQTGEPTLLTREGGSALTPEYAAPEQITGAPVTTATDIYSLGVLLYVLLSGQHPAGPGTHSAAQLVKAIVEGEPPRPSSRAPEKLRRQLEGDLDTIVAKALKKSPQERYASVTAFIDDVRRCLANEPITARPDTILYRARKFVRRNRTGVGVSVAALVIVISSLSAGLFVANSQRAAAQRQFRQVRQLANKFIDLDEQLRGVPGATEIRRQMVSDSLQYLSALSNEIHGDKDLALEIAYAYVRVAHVQGDPTSPNLGEFAAAETSLEKAKTLVEAVLATDDNNRRALFIAATIAYDRMTLADAEGRDAEAEALAPAAAAAVDRFMRLGNINSADLYSMTYFEYGVANVHAGNRHFEDATRAAHRAFEIGEPVPRAHERLYGAIFSVLMYALWQSGDLEGALENSRQSVRLTEAAAAKGHATMRSNLIVQLWNEGMLLGRADAEPNFGRTADALKDFQRAMDIAEDTATRDTADFLSHHRAALVALEIGNILRHTDPRKALAVYDHGLERLGEVKANAMSRHIEEALLAGSSYAAHRLGRDEDAKRRIDKAFELLKDAHEYPAEKVKPMSELDFVLRAQADLYAGTGQIGEAVKSYQELLNKLTAWKLDPQDDLRDATCISRTWTALAELLRRTQQADEATKLETLRAELWDHWKAKLPNGEFLLRQSLAQPYR